MFHVEYNNIAVFMGGEIVTNFAATLASRIIDQACQKEASDIHFYPFQNKDAVNVYYRVHGKRQFIQEINKSAYQVLLTYLKFSANMDIGEIQKPQDGIMTHQINNKNYSLRLSTLPITNSESVTIRILPQDDSHSVDQLLIFPNQLKTLKSWLNNKAGMLLFTGPTGSGKTSLMYALIELLQEKSVQIITLEDPVEKNLEHVIQVNINEKAGMSYSAGLKAALRHDPDVLMVGEIRDEQTALFSFQAALTGHLVMSTVHAKNVKGTIDRLIDLGVNRVELSQTLIAVAAVELLPIVRNNQSSSRAAILELLDGETLRQMISKEGVSLDDKYTFKQLRKRAYLYGFISKETFLEHENET